MSAASHSPNQPELEFINPPSSPAKGNADSDEMVFVEDSGNTGDQDRDPIVGVSEDDTIQDNDESNSESDLHESITDSSPKSATGDDFLMCSDTEETAVKSAHKRFCKKVQASCSPTKQGIWKDMQLEQIRNN